MRCGRGSELLLATRASGRSFRRLAIVALLLGWASGAAAGDWRFDPPARIVVVGDVHGAYDALVGLLHEAGLIDSRLDWAGGEDFLVSLGDLLDRGADSRRVMDLLMKLEGQADAAGGRVLLVLGNHELMNLTGDLRYVSAGEFAAFAADASGPDAEGFPPGYAAHRAAFAPDGRYGAWLRDRNAVVVIGRTAFVHGGLSPVVSGGPGSVNAQVRARLATAVDEAALAADPLFGDAGPFWYRGNATCHALLEGPSLDRAFERFAVDRVVIGHTPTASRRVESRLGGRVLMVDTGMLAEVYRGRASALVIEGERLSVVVAGESQARNPVATAGAYGGDFTARDALAATLQNGAISSAIPAADGRGALDVELATANGRVRARFERPFAAARAREAAAWALDRLLGLGIVRLAVRRTIDGRDGLLVEHPRGIETERQRLEAGRRRDDPCAADGDYALLRAFDALVANRSLDADEVGYDRGTGEIRVRGFADAFGRDRTIVATEPIVVPEGLRSRLAALEREEVLAATRLAEREVDALLARRDSLLAGTSGGYRVQGQERQE